MLKVQKIIELLLILDLIFVSYIDIKNKTVKIIDVIIIGVLSLLKFLLNKKIQITKFIILFGAVLLMLLASKILKQVIGYADIIVLGALSLIFSYYKIILFVFLSFLISGLGGVVIWINKRKVKDMTIPFLPYITISFITLLII